MDAKLRNLARWGLAALTVLGLVLTQAGAAGADDGSDASLVATATPIKHLIVIFQENVSFDHYFGTYPNAVNPAGEPRFTRSANTPNVNGLNGALLRMNPNLVNNANGAGASNPFRLDRSQNLTADQNHDYGPEQQSFDFGLMDAFPEFVGVAGPPPGTPPHAVTTTGLVMGYYDGNTVTALWNYAQNYALNDNHYNTNFGPSTVGMLNLVSGQTNGVVSTENAPSGGWISDGHGGLTVIGDPDPIGDLCSSSTGGKVRLGGPNIGDRLTSARITWGWFEGGFDLSIVNQNHTTGCNRTSTSVLTGVTKKDYIPHHEPFQYYASTANPNHLSPSSTANIGQTDRAKHQYDLRDFEAAFSGGNLSAVTFLKAIGIQDGHAAYSSPLDEQAFIVTMINALEQSAFWDSTAVVVLWDDSDGWYDHQMSPIVNHSQTTADQLTGDGSCGIGSSALPGVNPSTLHAQGRCGYGPRIPLLIISPWARINFVDHTLIDQSSVLRFIEDNWLGGRRLGAGSFDAIAGTMANMFDFTHLSTTKLILDPVTGEPVH
jgi:phospholipase C